VTHLYEQLLGQSFSKLPLTMRRFHTCVRASATGSFSVCRTPGWFSTLAARFFRLPPQGENVAVLLDVTALRDGERWRRRFGAARFDTVQYFAGGRLLERAGLVTITFDVRADGTGMSFTSVSCSFAGLRVPRWLAPTIEATTSATPVGWSMEVRVSAPHVGLVERYSGCVVPAS
jgi:hypothetical protein